MKVVEAPPPLGRKIRRFLRTYRAVFSVLILGVGVSLTLLALSAFTPLGAVPPFSWILPYTDRSASGGPNYNLVFAVVGPITVIVGAYLTGAYFVARRKFDHLMTTRSKAEFLRNLPEVERLLWDLTPADEIRYERKKAELHIRR